MHSDTGECSVSMMGCIATSHPWHQHPAIGGAVPGAGRPGRFGAAWAVMRFADGRSRIVMLSLARDGATGAWLVVFVTISCDSSDTGIRIDF